MMKEEFENIEQQLWEFVYELLPDDEADELRRLISSDADVARAYTRVKMRVDQVAVRKRTVGHTFLCGGQSGRRPRCGSGSFSQMLAASRQSG